MYVLKAIILAFSTYSRIPMPQLDYDDRAQSLSIAFLPLVGVVIVLSFIPIWFLYINDAMIAAAVTVLPIIITGDIHMDGYLDTVDALSARQDRERSLEILKDPHIGAFAVINYGVYLLIYFILVYTLTYEATGGEYLLIYPISRCFAAFTVLLLPKGKVDGMLASFTEGARRMAVYIILAVFTVLSLGGFIMYMYYNESYYSLTGIILCAIFTLWYWRMTKKRFGGVTGDTTGYYLQMTEIILLAGVLLGTYIEEIVYYGWYY